MVITDPTTYPFYNTPSHQHILSSTLPLTPLLTILTTSYDYSHHLTLHTIITIPLTFPTPLLILPIRWLEYDACPQKWMIRPTTCRGTTRGRAYILCDPHTRPEGAKGVWRLSDGKGDRLVMCYSSASLYTLIHPLVHIR